MRIELKDNWVISSNKIHNLKGSVPCTVLSSLLENHIIEDPYFRDNEEKARQYLFEDYVFENSFVLDEDQRKKHNYLCLDGICTIAAVFVNNVKIAEIFNFYTSHKFLLDNEILKTNNTIKIIFKSSYQYIKEYPNEKNLFQTYAVTDKNSPVIRQPNYMFGWDWGPSLADMGIINPIYILSTEVGYLKYFERRFSFSGNSVDVTITPHIEMCNKCNIRIQLKGYGFNQTLEAQNNGQVTFTIQNPELWYPNGFGKQPLYDLTIILLLDEEKITYTYSIGIREVLIDDSKDKHGRNLALYINNKKIFLKGSNFVPEDNLLSLINKERTSRLLNLAVSFNHNVIRVWGGGYYPNDDFYEICDRLGLLVAQDLMFACASYDIHDENFKKLIIEETKDNLRRISHHACLYMISGNNEIEDGVRGHGYRQTKNVEAMFINILRDIVNEETDLYYLPSSPTSGEPYFSSPNDPAFLDTHYWWVWGENRPFEDYLTIKPRLLSEFGCESLATYNTICRFTNEEDRTLNSPIMNHHEKSRAGNNDKIVKYVSTLFKPSDDLKKMSYLSMLTQAEGMKLCIEHLRQNKDICNGAMYWQLNDSWPGSTFSSIDYYFGIKALHYYSKRFYASHLISFNHEDKNSVNISNDSDKNKDYRVRITEFDLSGKVLNSKEIECQVNKYEDKNFDFEKDSKTFGVLVELFNDDHQLLSDNYLLDKKDKEINYPKANIKIEKASKCKFIISTDTFARGIYLVVQNNDVVFSDNFFNLLPSQQKIVTTNIDFEISDFEIICLNNI